MKCPHCGGQLDVDDGMESLYCRYCGTKIIVDPTELRVKEMEHEERMKDKENKLKSQKMDNIMTIVLVGVGLLVIVAFLGFGFLLKK